MHKSTPAPFYSDALTRGRANSPSSGPVDTPSPGGRYILGQILGEGTMGVVYLARDRETGGSVALKKLFRMDGKTVMRLKREFRALSDVSHPNLVKVYELGHMEDGWFLAMEYVEGEQLLTYLGMAKDESATLTLDNPEFLLGGGFDRKKVLSVFRQLARGVHALHRAGMLHRDLKPSNVMVAGGRVVVLDFGLVRELDEEAALLTEEGGVAGTPAYMAPEQILGRKLSEKTDWYAFGVVLYEAMTGRLPFDGTVYELIRAKQERDPVAPRRLNPELPADLERLCMALLSRDPAARPSGAEVLRQLDPRDEHQTKSSDLFSDGLTMHTDTRIEAVRAPFFGREPETAALVDALERVQGGETAVVHVRGVSGSGKSALVEHFLDEIELSLATRYRSAPLVLRSRCYEREAMPFKALDSVVDALARHLVHLPDLEVSHLLPTGLDALSRLFPVLQRLRAVQHLLSIRPVDGDAINNRQRAEQALRELFGRLSAQRLVVIWIDDLQWGDLDSARILRGWMQEAHGLSVLLVLSYRSEESGTSDCLRSILAGERIGQLLELSPLARADMVALCRSKLGELSAEHPELVQRIVDESEGSPFLAAQLATLVHAKARRGDRDYADVSLGDLLAQLTSILPDATRHLLEVLAIAGRPLLVKHALRAAGVRSGGRDDVHTLRRLQLVRSRTVGGERYLEVYHDRIREGIARNLGEAENRRIHGSLLKTLEYSGRAEPDALHALALSAGERVAALRYGLAAAERAAATLAFERAASLYEACLELSEPRASNRKLLLHRLADALACCGRGAMAAEAYLRAAELTDGAEALQLMRFAASHFLRSGRFEEGEALVDQLLAMNDLELPSTQGGLIAAIAWERARLLGRGLHYTPRAASEIPASALARIDLVGGIRLELMLVDPLRSALLLMRQVRWALDAGEPRRVLEALCGLCSLAATGSSRGQARVDALLTRAEGLLEQVDTTSARTLVYATRALAYWMVGRPQDVLAAAEEAERLYRLPEASQLYGGYYVGLAAVSVRIGALYDLARFDESAAALSKALREVQATDNRAARLYLALNEAGYAAIADRGDEAMARLKEQRSQLPRRGFGIYHALHLAAVCLIATWQGDHAWGLSILEEDWPRFEKSPVRRASMVHFVVRTYRLVLLLSYHLGELGGKPKSIALLKRELRAFERIEFRGRVASIAHIMRARVALAEGKRAQAVELTRKALATAQMEMDRLRATYALGCLLEGDEGQRLRDEALSTLRERGVPQPERYLTRLHSGFLG